MRIVQLFVKSSPAAIFSFSSSLKAAGFSVTWMRLSPSPRMTVVTFVMSSITVLLPFHSNV